MTLLIYIFGFIGLLVLLLLVIGLFTKKAYSVERAIVINKPRTEVFNYIKHLKNQDYYSKWVMMDPNVKKTYSGTDGTVGFIYAWDSNKQAGKGEQEIKNITEGERMDIEIRFEKPFEGVASVPFITESLSPDQTKVRWGMSSEMKYPMNLVLLFNIDQVLAKDLEISLANLKGKLEE